jgi:hypothetical protein
MLVPAPNEVFALVVSVLISNAVERSIPQKGSTGSPLPYPKPLPIATRLPWLVVSTDLVGLGANVNTRREIPPVSIAHEQAFVEWLAAAICTASSEQAV